MPEHYSQTLTHMNTAMRREYLRRIEDCAPVACKYNLRILRNVYWPDAESNDHKFIGYCNDVYRWCAIDVFRTEINSTWFQSRINALLSLFNKACPIGRLPVAMRIAKWLLEHKDLSQYQKAEFLQYAMRHCPNMWYMSVEAELKAFLERNNSFHPKVRAIAPAKPSEPEVETLSDSGTDDDVPDLSPNELGTSCPYGAMSCNPCKMCESEAQSIPPTEPEPQPSIEPEPVADDAPTTPAKGVSKPKLIKSLRRCGLDLKNIQRSRLRPTRKAKKFSNAKSLRFH